MSSLTQGLSERHFRSIVSLIETDIGIQLPAAKRTMLEGRLRRRVRALDLDGLDAYGRHLFDEGHLDEEYVHLVDCITTNKTDFFREPAHFALLRDELVPSLMARKHGTARLKLWSAAASIGAEAYTLAMVLQDMVAAGLPLDYTILGTDVSTEVLKVGRTAIYTTEMLSTVPRDMHRRYVMTARDAGREEGRIVPELRARVRFQHLNLLADRYGIDRDIDIVFCRNVLIYFDKPTQRAVLEQIANYVRPGGYLVVGHSESMAGSGLTRFTQMSSTVYRK